MEKIERLAKLNHRTQDVAGFDDYRTVSELLASGECPPEIFALLVRWANGDEDGED